MVVIVWSCFRMAKFITHSTLGYQYFYVRSSITIIIIIVVINISISRDIVIAIIFFLGEMIFELALSRFSIFCGRSSWTLRNVASKWQKVASNLGNPNTCSHPRIHTSGKLNLRISQDYKDFLLLSSRFHPSLIHAQMEVWKCIHIRSCYESAKWSNNGYGVWQVVKHRHKPLNTLLYIRYYKPTREHGGFECYNAICFPFCRWGYKTDFHRFSGAGCMTEYR